MKSIIIYLCVISILSLLIYIGFSLQKSMKVIHDTRRISVHNLDSIKVALEVYASDNDGILPENLGILVPKYLEHENCLISPRPFQKTGSSQIIEMPYEYLVAGKKWNELKDSDILVKEPSCIKDHFAIRKGPEGIIWEETGNKGQ